MIDDQVEQQYRMQVTGTLPFCLVGLNIHCYNASMLVVENVWWRIIR